MNRNDALNVRLRKSQKNALKAVAKYLETNEIKMKSKNNINQNEENNENKPLTSFKIKNTTKPNNKTIANHMIEGFCETTSKRLHDFCITSSLICISVFIFISSR